MIGVDSSEDRCEIGCLTCGNKFSVANGEEEINWICPVCGLADEWRRLAP